MHRVEVESVELTDVTRDNPSNDKFTVVIVGGGPAGIATALTLNALGVSNCIIEASKSPNRKIGEAIPPNAKPLLKQLGIHTLVEDPHHQKYYGNQSCWGSDSLEQKEFISEVHGHGYLLDRLYFENQLWGIYQDGGGSLYSGSRLLSVEKGKDHVSLSINKDSQSLELKCTYIVDATGRKSSICRQLGISKVNLDTQFALSFSMTSKDSMPRKVIVEATQNGWWYVAPNGNTEITVMFFTLKNLLPQKKDATDFIIHELRSSLHVSKIISFSEQDELNIKITPTGTSRLKIPYGDNWMAVGDAAISYDPISSYGITSALASGYYAGQAIASNIQGRKEAMYSYRYIMENAFDAYCEKLVKYYSQEQRFEGSYYWTNRFSIPELALDLR